MEGTEGAEEKKKTRVLPFPFFPCPFLNSLISFSVSSVLSVDNGFSVDNALFFYARNFLDHLLQLVNPLGQRL